MSGMKNASDEARRYLAGAAASRGDDGHYAAPCRTAPTLPSAGDRQPTIDGSDDSFLFTVGALAAVEIALTVAWLIGL